MAITQEELLLGESRRRLKALQLELDMHGSTFSKDRFEQHLISIDEERQEYERLLERALAKRRAMGRSSKKQVQRKRQTRNLQNRKKSRKIIRTYKRNLSKADTRTLSLSLIAGRGLSRFTRRKIRRLIARKRLRRIQIIRAAIMYHHELQQKQIDKKKKEDFNKILKQEKDLNLGVLRTGHNHGHNHNNMPTTKGNLQRNIGSMRARIKISRAKSQSQLLYLQ